jgi:glutathione synthase/RimK-type ligase-like ATP-grasp enzyme
MPVLNIFEWIAWDRFLAVIAVPETNRIRVTPGHALRPAEADAPAALLHVNLSQPNLAFPNYREWLASYEEIGRPVINGYCASIDKWSVQDACARAGLPQARAARDGEAGEMLIAKSRANYGGLGEGKLDAGLVGDLSPPPWPYPERVQLFRRDELPAPMWDDPRLTVERYVNNPEGKFRRTYVVGEYVGAVTSRSDDVLKSLTQREGSNEFVSVKSAKDRPDDPRDPLYVTYRIAQAMRVDFAAIDLALDDDGVNHPIDVNTTPSWGTGHNPRLLREVGEAMAVLVERGSLWAAG